MKTKGEARSVGFDYKPFDRQVLFHSCPADEVLYGGAAGGGKTKALIAETYKILTSGPGRKVLFLRRMLPDLMESAIQEAHESYPPEVMAWFDKQKKYMCRQTGSSLKFGHAMREKDVERYKSAQYDTIILDELTTFTEWQYKYLKSRNRSIVPGVKCRMLCASNPGDIGHLWVKNYFVAVADPLSIYTDPKTGLTRCFIPSRVYDNLPLMQNDPDYVKRLESLPEAERKQLLDGSWDMVAGAAFSEWDPDIHIVKPFPIPIDWPRYRAIDYGYRDPFCCLWFAISPYGIIYVYREHYAAKKDLTWHCEMINALSENESYEYTVIDPQTSESRTGLRGETGETVADILYEYGIVTVKADRSRINGNAVFHRMLMTGRLRFFEDCENCISTIPALPLAAGKADDVETKAPDHCYDTVRYFLMSRHAAGESEQEDGVSYVGQHRSADNRDEGDSDGVSHYKVA